MSTATISPSFEIEIPEDVREALHLTPGQKVLIYEEAGRIHIEPVPALEKPISEYRGILKGMNLDFEREPDRM